MIKSKTTLRYIAVAGMAVILFISSVRKPIQPCKDFFYISYYNNGKRIFIDSVQYFSRTGLQVFNLNGKTITSDRIVIQLK